MQTTDDNADDAAITQATGDDAGQNRTPVMQTMTAQTTTLQTTTPQTLMP